LCYERVGQAEQASADARKALDMNPEDLSARLVYARMLVNLQKYREAEKEIAVARELNPNAAGVNFTAAFLTAARGKKEEALTLVKAAEAQPVFYSYLLSRVYAALNLKDKAVENIRLAIDKGFPEMLDFMYDYPFLNTNRFFDNLRDDPRFREILAGQKKKCEQNLDKYGTL
jgi:tetratricopeptide (TPR) repeat protein